MPYTEALRLNREHRTLIDQIMALEDIGQKLHSAFSQLQTLHIHDAKKGWL